MNSTEDNLVGETTDPQGNQVVLLDRIWHGKVVRNHPEMTLLERNVLDAVAAPDHIEDDPVRHGRVRYFARDVGPSQWLLAVVSYEQVPARIVSAFAHRKDPRTWSE